MTLFKLFYKHKYFRCTFSFCILEDVDFYFHFNPVNIDLLISTKPSQRCHHIKIYFAVQIFGYFISVYVYDTRGTPATVHIDIHVANVVHLHSLTSS